MKKTFLVLAISMLIGNISAIAAPDLTDLLKSAAQAAQNSSSSKSSSETTSKTNNTNNSTSSTGESDNTQSNSSNGLGGLLGGLGGLLGGNGNSQPTGSSSGSSDLMSGLSGLLNGLISNDRLTVADLTGKWKYSQPAVTFQSDNFLQKAGGAAASGVINSKIGPYYEKIGMDNLEVTFDADSTFIFKLPKLSATGTVSVAPEGSTGNFIFSFKALGKIPVGNMTAQVEKQLNSLTITFDASKLITLVNAIANVTGQSTLQTVSQLLNSYDGLNIGFELKPVK